MSVRGAPCDFARDFEVAQSPLMREIERRVRGSDYGATSWTTRKQAEQAAARLALAPGVRLLDVGAGSGWPGLFLAAVSGCEVVLADLPLSALRVARTRAASDGLTPRCAVLAADGAALPFADRSFDRIHHADVLCCMEPKREMLRECRRVARKDARMEFSVIYLDREPDGDEEYQLLQKSGPPYPDAGGGYEELLAATGWRVRERIDVTREFARCMDILLQEANERREALLELLGKEEFAERRVRRESTRAAVSRGLLKRAIFTAATGRA